MPARTGREFLEGLRDGREVWVGAEKVADIAGHPSLSGAARTVAAIYDLQHEAADACLMPDPETGEPVAVSHLIPRSRADLARRHQAIETVAEYSVGLMARTPDYVNVTLAGFAGREDEWARYGNERGAENLIRYQKTIARGDLCLTPTIVHATVDRARGNLPSGLDPVGLHKVEDTSRGILVRGSRVLATLAPFADEIVVYPSAPMPDADPAHALCFAVPVSTPGLKFLCRDSVAVDGSVFDSPLSSRFDEQDAFVIFDDVEVPRERVFINANLAAYNTVTRTSLPANVMQHNMIRARVKLEFAWGLACRMAEAINLSQPAAQQMLGEIAAYAALARASITAAEQGARDYGNGLWLPEEQPLYALRALLPGWFPRVNEIIRLLGSHNLLTTPSSAQFADPGLRPLLDTYLRGAGSVSAEERARVFRLAWDFAGTALAGRNEQYERFYLGSAARNLQNLQARSDRARADRLVNRFIQERPARCEYHPSDFDH
jgi:4-hydroxyphenylacetate 3-monooxygenase